MYNTIEALGRCGGGAPFFWLTTMSFVFFCVLFSLFIFFLIPVFFFLFHGGFSGLAGHVLRLVLVRFNIHACLFASGAGTPRELF